MYFKSLLSTLLTLIALSSAAQKMSRLDSLKLELGVGADSSRHRILYAIADELFDFDNPQAATYARHAYELSLKQGDTLDIVKSGVLLGQLLRRVDEPDAAIEMLEKMVPIAERNHIRRYLKVALNSLAVAHTYMARYDKALEYNLRSLIIREKEGDKKDISVALHNIGLVYYKLGQNDKALEYYFKCLEAKREANYDYDIHRTYINIGLSYNDLREFSKAQDYFDLGFKACKECRDEVLMEAESGLAISLVEQKKYSEAKPHLLRGLELARKENSQRFQLENLARLGEVATFQGDLDEARNYLTEAESFPVLSQYKDIQRTLYQKWSNLYKAAKDYEKAYQYEHRYSQLNDSILSRDVLQNLTRVQTQYAERENLAIIADREQTLALRDRLISQQRVFNILLGAVVVLITALVVSIWRNNLKIRQVNTDLAAAKQVIEDQNKFLDHEVQEKTKELVFTNENLRKVNDELDNFIYKTSHDIRGPLASLKGMVNLAIMDVKDDKALGYLNKLDLTAEKLNIILTRLLIVNKINHAELKPEPILFEPIIQEILTLEMKKGLPPKVKIDYEVGPDIQLVSDREMVKLILENLIDNAIKFYNESERIDSFVHIKVAVENGDVVAHVVDNGVGIAQMNRDKIFQMFVRASERSESGGIGLYLAKLASEKLSGEITFSSTEGKLTEFIVRFPSDLGAILERRKEEQRRHAVDAMRPTVRHNAA